MSERMVEFAVAGWKLVAKKFLIADITSEPLVSQEALKNAEVRPSGPGALLGLSLKRTDLISTSVGDREHQGNEVLGQCKRCEFLEPESRSIKDGRLVAKNRGKVSHRQIHHLFRVCYQASCS